MRKFSRFGMGMTGVLLMMYVVAMAFGAGDIEAYGVIDGTEVQCAIPDDNVWVCEPKEK